MEKPYAFRREDDLSIVWVDFETMMQQDSAGYIRLPDGTLARRCLRLEHHAQRTTPRPERAIPTPAVSDTLGFPEQSFAAKEAQRQQLGCSDVWFERDPKVPEYFRVHGSSWAALDKYTKKRNLVNRTGSLGGAVKLSQEDLERAAELVSRPR